MSSLERLFEEVSDVKRFASGYFTYLYAVLGRLDVNVIAAFVDEYGFYCRQWRFCHHRLAHGKRLGHGCSEKGGQ